MTVQSFKHRFTRLDSHLDILELKINAKSGFWVFKSHVHTVDQLFESKELKAIYSISEKTNDDINHMIDNNNFSGDTRNLYNLQRDLFEKRLRDINFKIADRQPTWWEILRAPMVEFVKQVMNFLPTRYQSLLHHVGVKLLGYSEMGAKKGYKLLVDKIKR